LGITNVVASSGTSLTIDQIRLIRKFTNNVTIIYDGDGAGIKAALRGIDLVLKEGMNVKVVLLPDGQDPDDFARRHTLEQVQDHIARNEQDFISFKTDLLLGEAGGDPLKKAALINDIADTIALIPDAVIRAVYVRSCSVKFEIDEQILSERVSTSRSSMIISEQEQKMREKERAARQASAGVPPPVIPEDYPAVPEYDMPPVDMVPVDMAQVAQSQQAGLVMNEPALEPCEKEILGFILESGCSQLLFDVDSKYYVSGETVNVAEFIDGILAEDDAVFHNDPYRKVYDEYFRMYDEGLSQQQIQKRLLDSMDETISSVSKDILIEKYQITVKNYEDSLTAETTRLVQFVPKALLAYQTKKVELMLKELTLKLMSAQEEEQESILKQITEYNRAKTRLNKELGRV
jgi:DNA primase